MLLERLSVPSSSGRLSLVHLKQEAALLSARLALRQPGGPLLPVDAFGLLVSSGRLFEALALGKQYRLDLGPAFDALTRRCLAGGPLCSSDDECTEGVEEGLSNWSVLQQLLRQHDSRASNWSYGTVCARAVLESEPQLPTWLTAHLTAHNPEALFAVLLTYGQLLPAADLALQLVADPDRLLPVGLLDKLLFLMPPSDDARKRLKRAVDAAKQE